MEELETRVALTVLSGTMDPDVIHVRRPANNPAALRVTITRGADVFTDVTLTSFTNSTLEINAGAGADTFRVDDSLAGIVLALNGEGDDDTFLIGSTTGSLDDLDGDVIVDGGAGAGDALSIEDEGNGLARIYTVTGDSVARDGSAPIVYDATIDSLDLHGGGPYETYDIESTAAGVATTITGGDGTDIFRVSPTARHLGDIAGELTVHGGGGTNVLDIHDDLTLGAVNYTVTDSSVSAGSATVNYGSLSGTSPLDLYGAIDNGLGPVTYNVESTAPDTTVTIYGNGGDETVHVSPTLMDLGAIRGDLSFVGGGGTDAIFVNDQGNPEDDGFELSGSSVSRDGSATVFFGFFDVSRTIRAGGGRNTVDVSGLPASGSLAFHGGGGSDTLNGPDLANTFEITGANVGKLSAPGLGALDFSSVEGVSGNLQPDRIVFRPSGSLAGRVDGGGGKDTIDYSAKKSPVVVNLPARTGTATGGVYRIENVTGGRGDDTLIGNGSANVLQGNGGHDIVVGNGGSDTLNGGAGRDVLLGGSGPDTISGGSGDDILVGGTTSHDADLDALDAVRDEWISTSDYSTRVLHLKGSPGGLNGIYSLVSSGSDRTVVNDDGSVDTLSGGSGLDWFFYDPSVDSATPAADEQIN